MFKHTPLTLQKQHKKTMQDNRKPFAISNKFSWEEYYGKESYDAYALIDNKNYEGLEFYIKDMICLLREGTLVPNVVDDRLKEIESYLNVGHGYDFAKLIDDSRNEFDQITNKHKNNI